MVNKTWSAALVALLLTASGPAALASDTTNSERDARHYLDQMAIMDAQIAYMRKEDELRSVLAQRAHHESLPKIVSIVRDNKGAQVLVVFDTGVARWMRSGDTLTGDLSIKQIDRAQVIVSNNREEFALAFIGRDDANRRGANVMPLGPLPAPPKVHMPMLPAEPATSDESRQEK